MLNEIYEEKWLMKLYVAGRTEKSIRALENLQKICENNLQGKYQIEVIDIYEKPEMAKLDQIVSIPTVIRRLPPPLVQIIGDLSDQEKVLKGLHILPYV